MVPHIPGVHRILGWVRDLHYAAAAACAASELRQRYANNHCSCRSEHCLLASPRLPPAGGQVAAPVVAIAERAAALLRGEASIAGSPAAATVAA